MIFRIIPRLELMDKNLVKKLDLKHSIFLSLY